MSGLVLKAENEKQTTYIYMQTRSELLEKVLFVFVAVLFVLCLGV